MSLNPQSSTAAARISATAIGTAGVFILFAAYMVIPPAGFIPGLLAPFPAIFFRLRHGRGTGVIITLGATTLLTAAFGVQAGAAFLLQCGVSALLLPEFLVRGYGAARTITWTTAVNMAAFALAALAFSLLSGSNIHLLAVKEINDSIAQTIAIYEKSGIKGDELDLIKRSMTMAAAIIIRIYPALLTLLLIIISGGNMALLKRLSARTGLDLKIGAFNNFRSHFFLVWVLIAAGFAMLAKSPIITTPALNLLVILTAVYFLQGLAVILTIIARQTYSGAMRVMLFLMLLFQPYLAALVTALGIFDLWGDFRTPRKQENL